MVLKDRLIYYNQITGPGGKRLATLFRFQSKPGSDYPRIYLPYDSLLNHASRLVRNTKLWLSDILPASDLVETQLVLIGHDVMEIVDGDVNRLDFSFEEAAENSIGEGEILLPEDVIRYRHFQIAQNFLEKGGDNLPPTAHPVIARLLDTIDGNFFAFALLEHYISKVGGEEPDPKLQQLLDRSYVYINKMRSKYRAKTAKTAGKYHLDLVAILERLQRIEAEKLDHFSAIVEGQGYRITALV